MGGEITRVLSKIGLRRKEENPAIAQREEGTSLYYYVPGTYTVDSSRLMPTVTYLSREKLRTPTLLVFESTSGAHDLLGNCLPTYLHSTYILIYLGRWQVGNL